MAKTQIKTRTNTLTKVALVMLAIGSLAAAVYWGIEKRILRSGKTLTVQFQYGAGEKCQGIEKIKVEKVEPAEACQKSFLEKDTYKCEAGAEVKVWIDTPFDKLANPNGCDVNGRWGCDQSGFHYCVVHMDSDRQIKYEAEIGRKK
ncbi:MAG: hypothetical protein NTZ97_01475 [Candidatus Moranbacteria bacterium]|nr:hypothetical protein [Candidatus Moranbacteria bacterium]